MKRGLDALLVTAPGNIYYLSAFHTPAYDNFQFMLLPASGEPTMFNNVHESEYLVGARSHVRKRAAYPGWLSHTDIAAELLAKEGLAKARIGIEKSSFFFTIADFEKLTAKLPQARFEDASGIVEPFRRVKSAEELAVIRQAARVVEAGMKAGVEAIREGVADCEISAEVHHGLIGAGGDYMSYPPFVNVGWNSSLVHNTWNGMKVKSGDLVFLEISGVVKRYGAALMRSVAVGKISDEMERRNTIVHDVLARTLDAIKPGVTSGSVNQVCLETYAAPRLQGPQARRLLDGYQLPAGLERGQFPRPVARQSDRAGAGHGVPLPAAVPRRGPADDLDIRDDRRDQGRLRAVDELSAPALPQITGSRCRMAARTRLYTDVDYEKNGKQVGWLYMPHSVTRSAYGNIAIPVASVKNGSGPTIFLMAGNHGDEYEGQIALCKLIRSIDPGRVQGRIIVMPAANLPAALASARVSPIDQGNLNRAFPGDPDGTPTQQIAWYIDQVLYPMSQFHHDIHSGGTSLDYVPFVSMRKTGDADLDMRTMAALKAFDAPNGLVWALQP